MIAETIHTKTPDRFLKQKPTKDAELPLAIPDWKQIVALLSSSPCWILQLDLASSTVSHPLLTLSLQDSFHEHLETCACSQYSATLRMIFGPSEIPRVFSMDAGTLARQI